MISTQFHETFKFKSSIPTRYVKGKLLKKTFPVNTKPLFNKIRRL